MASLEETLRQTVQGYVAHAYNLKMFMFSDENEHAYAVVTIETPVRRFKPLIVVMARIVDDKIVIEEDNTDRHLVDALLQNGIPREKIVLIYDDESIPLPPTGR